MLNGKVRINKKRYKNKKPKHFECTRCHRKVGYVTTKKELAGVNILPEGHKLCAWCVTKYTKAFEQAVLNRIRAENGKEANSND